MAVAAPARKAGPAPAPSRTSPPPKKAAPSRPVRHHPAPRRRAAAAPARTPGRAKPKTKRAGGGQLIPLAVGRTAVAVRQLPDSGLVVRMTRGRAWIGVLGVLLVGIVALNVVTLSFAASSGKISEQITALEQENSILAGRYAQRSGVGPVRLAAGPLGLAMPPSEAIRFTDAGPHDVATAAQRLAAAGPG